MSFVRSFFSIVSVLVVCVVVLRVSCGEAYAQAPGGLGKIAPPTSGQSDPSATISNIIVFGIGSFFTVGFLAALFYMLWGGFDWVTSEGNKEKLDKARQKITHAAFGILLSIVLLSGFFLIMNVVLGNNIIRYDYNTGKIEFDIPRIGQ